MSMVVKVNKDSVVSFNNAVLTLQTYSEKLDEGIEALESLTSFIESKKNVITDSVPKLENAEKVLSEKIKEIEAEIVKLTERLNTLNDQLSALESELDEIPETYTVTDENGETHEEDNPAYEYVEDQISDLENEIDEIEGKISSLQEKLSRIRSLESEIKTHVEKIESTTASLNGKSQECRRLIADLSEDKSSTFQKSSSVRSNLKKIEDLIDEYVGISLLFNEAQSRKIYDDFGNTTPVNANINVRQNINVSKEYSRKSDEGNQEEISLKRPNRLEIIRHGIVLDENNHICEYDGLVYGGKYNSYEIRVKFIPLDDPERGYWDGVRGESKYVPSGNNEGAIAARMRLKEYHLDGIIYRNGEPDFSYCSEATVTIQNMTVHRENYYDSDGMRLRLGNFSQADIQCAKLWREEGKDGRTDWTKKDVKKYRKQHGLTWHEKCDQKTMMLVPYEVNDFFGHTGGVSECRTQNSVEAVFDE